MKHLYITNMAFNSLFYGNGSSITVGPRHYNKNEQIHLTCNDTKHQCIATICGIKHFAIGKKAYTTLKLQEVCLV